jgi:hypothetical protein
MSNDTTQDTIIMDYFKKNPNRDIPHPEIVDWVTAKYKKLTGHVFRDPDRQIRKLHQSGYLIKVKKGVYRYDPSIVVQRDLEDFSPEQKKQILERDGHQCVICGRGEKDGVELQIDHIRPKDLDGKATIENGQTLCAQHNFIKKNMKQTETGKKMFIRLYELSKIENNQELLDFCTEILKVYEHFNINGHIVWKK